MRGFPGFPAGVQRLIAVPEAFFSELLPAIDNLCELKVTLHCLWLLQRKSGNVRYVTLGELEQDGLLLSGLTDDEAIYPAISPLDALRDGLERATARGTLLQVTVDAPGRRQESLYLLNTERGRETVQRIERGEWVPPDAASDVRLRARRPNIFNLYEQNIGLIQPLIAEELKEAPTMPGVGPMCMPSSSAGRAKGGAIRALSKAGGSGDAAQIATMRT